MSQPQRSEKEGGPARPWLRYIEPAKNIKMLVLQQLLDDSGGTLDTPGAGALLRKTRRVLRAFLAQHQIEQPEDEREALCEQIVADALGLGPLAYLLEDPTVGLIMIVGPDRVFASRGPYGVRPEPVRFRSEEHLRQVIDHLIAPLGRRMDERQPLLVARLPDRPLHVHAIIPPVAVGGAVLTIRKAAYRVLLTVQNIIDYGTATVEVMEFLRACVIAGFNIIVAGNRRLGKTTLLNILCGFIPADERIVTVEHTTELELAQPHLVRLARRFPTVQGEGEISVRELTAQALYHYADHLVVGELLGGEVLALVNAMYTGYGGAMTTLYSTSPRDTLARLETLCLTAGEALPAAAINGINLHYECEGQGPDVLFLHGLGSSAADWAGQVGALKAHYRCITYDARGHGQSDKPDSGPYLVPQHAADAFALLDHLGVGRAALVGLSLGGMIAFQMAVDAPQRLSGMVIINSGPRMKPETLVERMFIWQRLLMTRLFSMRQIGEAIGRRLFPDESQAALRASFIEAWARNDKRAYTDATRGLVGWSVAPHIASIQVPTLVIAADQDYTPVAAKQAYVVQMPHAELAVVENARHAVNIAAPEKVNRLIEPFLQRVTA